MEVVASGVEDAAAVGPLGGQVVAASSVVAAAVVVAS